MNILGTRVKLFYVLVGIVFLFSISIAAQDTAHESIWNRFKNIPLGFVNLDIGGSLRLRYQSQNNFNIKKY